jgi:hypothetical protein
MLRCGAIKTMRDPKFIQYRQAPDQVSILTGSLFWGAYFSSILVGTVFGLVVFFFLWQSTIYIAQRVIALVVGFLVITIIRITLVSMCRCSMYKAFYRKRPALANFTMLGEFSVLIAVSTPLLPVILSRYVHIEQPLSGQTFLYLLDSFLFA